jgi:hypothetical protein
VAISNDTSELITQISNALRNLAEVASEATQNHAQYQLAWEETKRMWNEATSPLGRLAAQVGLNTPLCKPHNNAMWHNSVFLGDWPRQPIPPDELDNFLEALLNSINERVQQLHTASAVHKKAATVLHELAKALAPEAAMQKLAE